MKRLMLNLVPAALALVAMPQTAFAADPPTPNDQTPATPEEAAKKAKADQEAREKCDSAADEASKAANAALEAANQAKADCYKTAGLPAPAPKVVEKPLPCIGVDDAKAGRVKGVCACGNPNYVPMLRPVAPRAIVCMPTHDLSPELQALGKQLNDLLGAPKDKSPYAGTAFERIEDAERRLGALDSELKMMPDPTDKAERKRIVSGRLKQIEDDLAAVKAGLETLAKIAESHSAAIVDIREKIAKLPVHAPFSTGLSVGGGARLFPGTGAAGTLKFALNQKFWFAPDSRWYIPIVGEADRLWNARLTPSTGLGGGTGVGVCVTLDCMHMIDLTVQGLYVFSDHDVGSNPQLKTSGMAASVMGVGSYTVSFAKYFAAEFSGGLGWAKANGFDGNGVLQRNAGLTGMVGAALQFHVDYGIPSAKSDPKPPVESAKAEASPAAE